MFSFLPKDEKFFQLFEQAASNSSRAAGLLRDMIDDFGSAQAYASKIKSLEDAGDSLTHEIVKRLNLTFATPMDREDIHAIATHLDDVVDWIDAAAARLVDYQVGRPTEEARQFAEIIHHSVQSLYKAVVALQTRNLERIHQETVEVNRLENEADKLLRRSLVGLFNGSHDPLTVIKWKEIYESLEEVTDHCEDVSNLIESVVMKSA